MKRKVYKGVVREGCYGRYSEALFIGNNKEPIAQIFEEDFQYKKVTVRYWTSDTEKPKEELKKDVLRKIFGDVEADYGDRYSDYTGYLWTNEKLNIANHNLLEEIRSHIGRFIYIEIDVHN